MRMFKISFSVLAALFVGFFVLPSLLVFSQESQDAPTHPEIPPAGDALQVTLGRDSPNLGGNVFRDAFLSFTLSNAPGIATGKVTSDISFPSSEGIAFDRAELTPDLEASGATLEIEVVEGEEAPEAGEEGETAQEEGAELTPDLEASGATLEVEVVEGEEASEAGEEGETAQEEGATSRVKITISNDKGLPDGIIANLVFKITKEFTFEEVGTDEHLITLENEVSAWSTDEQEIVDVLGEPGGIDLAYAPVVFACFFYMH